MNISVILGHPQAGSFNHAIYETCIRTLRSNGHVVYSHDLYQERFDPLLPGKEIPDDADLPDQVKKQCDEIAIADGIIIIHPNWWGQPPAVLKGWVDRVLRPGVAYKFEEGDSGEGVPIGLLRAKCALVFNTSNTKSCREQMVFGDPLERIWKNCIFDLCGVQQYFRRMFCVIVTSTPEQRSQWLDEVSSTVTRYFSPEQ